MTAFCEVSAVLYQNLFQFLLPAIVHTCGQQPRGHQKNASVLVLLPTRELAQQVEAVAKEYCKVMNLSATCLFGGAPKSEQARDLERGESLCDHR